MVGQEPVLFAESIEKNIAYGLDETAVSLEDVQSVAGLANAHDFIETLANGYKTNVGDKGLQLSGN